MRCNTVKNLVHRTDAVYSPELIVALIKIGYDSRFQLILRDALDDYFFRVIRATGSFSAVE